MEDRLENIGLSFKRISERLFAIYSYAWYSFNVNLVYFSIKIQYFPAHKTRISCIFRVNFSQQ